MKKKIIVCAILLIVIGIIIYSLMNPVDMAGMEGYESRFYSSPIALLPPLIAIVLALITKEVYSLTRQSR